MCRRSGGVRVGRGVAFCLLAGAGLGCGSAAGVSPAAPAPIPQRLTAAPPEVDAACTQVRRAAVRQHARWRVVCPPLVPRSGLTSVEATGLLGLNDFRAGYLLDGLSPVGAYWTKPGDGHWTFAAGSPRAVGGWRTSRDAAGRPQIAFSRRVARIAGWPVTIYRIPHRGMNEFSGHVVIEWRWRGEAYEVSVHRWLSDRQGVTQASAMATAVIRRLRRR